MLEKGGRELALMERGVGGTFLILVKNDESFVKWRETCINPEDHRKIFVFCPLSVSRSMDTSIWGLL
jgi:hypothetical protein